MSIGIAQIMLGLAPDNGARDILTFAAATANLPHLTEVYATASSSIRYYNQADLVCGLAASTADRLEIEKYRRFLSLTLKLSSGMAHASQGNLYYCRAKLDLKLGDKASAIRDFNQAIDYSPSVVTRRADVEPAVREFLAANSLR